MLARFAGFLQTGHPRIYFGLKVDLADGLTFTEDFVAVSSKKALT
jgi:hypothetical protein